MCSSPPLWPQPPAAPVSTGRYSNPCVITPIELARSQDWGRGRGGDLVPREVEVWSVRMSGHGAGWKLGDLVRAARTSFAPFPVLPPIRPPARSGSNPPQPGCFIGQSTPLGASVLPGSQPDRTNRAVDGFRPRPGKPLGRSSLRYGITSYL